ncbi:MAG: ribosome small subunit-dependent GTPase A [Ruminococcaceae bacterium]|nr:ribosome small subunit-dependent GTPase A [Oscillospiraceae bacterium]
MAYYQTGRITKCVGGLYTVSLDSEDKGQPLYGVDVECRARGSFRHEGVTPLVGDRVTVQYGDGSFTIGADGRAIPVTGGADTAIDKIAERKNALIRPPVANIDTMLVCMASGSPAPDLYTIDKLLCILEFNGILPVIVIGKAELAENRVNEITEIYEKAGYKVFSLSCAENFGTSELHRYIDTELKGQILAVAGASGVGKSTLLNTLFPELSLVTGDISRKISRGKNTTRHTQLYPLSTGGYIADTAGFSLLDFERFDFMDKDDLPHTMREFRPFLGSCRYTDCTHTKEEDCAVVTARRRGEISPSRHQSFVELYGILKEKHKWDKKD